MIAVKIEYNGHVGSLGAYEPHRAAIQDFVDQKHVVGWINRLEIEGSTVSLVVSGYHQAPSVVATLNLESDPS